MNFDVFLRIIAQNVLYWQKKTGDSKWEKVETESIPEEGITVTVPYPDGITRKTYDGVVAYIYPCDLEWEEAGKINTTIILFITISPSIFLKYYHIIP